MVDLGYMYSVLYTALTSLFLSTSTSNVTTSWEGWERCAAMLESKALRHELVCASVRLRHLYESVVCVRFDAGGYRHGSRTLPLGGRLQLGVVKGWPGRLWTNTDVDRHDGIIRVECDLYLAEP